jgi:mono/diheme cytochrome c family protein
MWDKAPAMLAAMQARGIPLPQLRAEEMADIVAYLYAVQYFAVPGDRQRGARVAKDKGCLGCHTVLGRDGTAPAELSRVAGLESPAGVIGALWNHSFLSDPAAGKRGWSALRPDEMADLLAFLRSLRPTP